MDGDPPTLFDEWTEYVGLTKNGKEKLEKATVCSVQAVKCLTEDDIVEIRLGVGDRGLFKAAWKALSVPSELPEYSPDPNKPAAESVSAHVSSLNFPTGVDTESKVYSIADVAKFLGQTPSVPSASGVSTLLTGVTPIVGARTSTRAASSVTAKTLAKDQLLNRLAGQFAQGGLQDSLSLQELSIAGLLKGDKALLPVNFVTIFTGCGAEDEEVLGCGQNQGRLVWQSGKSGTLKKPTADRLSYGQFFEANARILNLLNLDEESYTEYLDYLRQLGILLQTFTASSVFTLDHIHRQFVHETSGRWNFIENTLENSVLKKKDEFNRGVSHGSHAQGPRHNDSRGNSRVAKSVQPGNSEKHCWMYNLYKGCPYGPDKCYYPHVCSVDQCRGNHPAYKHAEVVGERSGKGSTPEHFKSSS